MATTVPENTGEYCAGNWLEVLELLNENMRCEGEAVEKANHISQNCHI